MNLEKLKSDLRANQKNMNGVSDKTYQRIGAEMRPDETLLKLCIGYDKGNTYIACTDQRIIKLTVKTLFGRETEDIMYSNVVSVEQKKGFATSEITIHSKSNSIKTETIANDMATEFVSWLRNRISRPTEPAVIINSSDDIITRLERLAALKEKGLLSEQEFQEQKIKLLNT